MKKKINKRTVLEVVELGDKRLRAKSKDVSFPISNKNKELIDVLIKTCKAKRGVGIAAPQVGKNLRIFIVWPDNKFRKKFKSGKSQPSEAKPIIVINPKIISKSKKMVKDWEGCLSIPGIRGLVPRYFSLEAEFLDGSGRKISKKFSGFSARIFQHEFDHLNGIVFIDRADSKDIVTEKEFQKRIEK